jgi:DNA repair exonuclease SbcCD ATPase subunit
MSIKLKNLNFSNMYSYGENISIDLSNEKITQLSAPNGSGKSSIALILQEILFNKNIKGIKKGDILNKYVKSKSWDANLTFSIEKDNYYIEVKRSGAQTKVVLKKNELDISEHKVLDTYKKLHEDLGMSFEIFSQLTYQSSTDLLDFLKATDANRKKFLINLFNFEKYIDIGEKIKRISNDLDKELATKRGELNTVEDYLESVVIKEKRDFVEVPDVDKHLNTNVIDLEAQLQNLDKDIKSIDKNNMYIRERDSLSFDMSMIRPTDPLLTEEISNARDGANNAKRVVQETESKIKQLDLSENCYACGQTLDNSQSLSLKIALEETITKEKNKYSVFKEKYLTLKEENDEYLKDLKLYEANQKLIEKFESLSNLIDTSLSVLVPNKTEIQKELVNVKKEWSTQTSKKEDAEKTNEEVRLHNTKIDMLSEEKEKFLSRQKVLKSAIVVLQNKQNNLQILKKAFSSSGIVAFKLENVAKDLENTINKYLSVLSDGQFSVVFRLTGEKLNVIIINNGHEVTIESLSGGEFSRVQTSVLLAVRATLSKIGGKQINLLFLDEITGVLDDSGKEKLFEVLSEEIGLNVFLISHDYSHPLIPKVEITKTNNISNII